MPSHWSLEILREDRKMTKKHFIPLALVIRELLEGDHKFTPDQSQSILRAISDFCADMNPRFNSEKFASAAQEQR
jgi:hypothetical protein